MEDIAKVIGLNIEKLKQSKGLTNEEIGNIIGVTRVTVAKYLSGDQVIDSAKLFKLANQFNLPLSWFMKSNDEPMTFMFRADNPQENFDDNLARSLNKFLNEYIHILEIAEENHISYLPQAYRLHLKGNKLSEDDHELIREIAEKQRKQFGLEEVFDYDIYSILEKNNINVVSLNLNNRNIYGLSAYSKDKGAFIVINDHPNIPEERKIFSALHELGHLIFHRDDYKNEPVDLAYSKSRNNINEKIANTFASYFLIPRNQLRANKKYFRGFVSEFSNIFRIKKEFGASALALMLALLEEGYIDNRNYGFLKKRLNESGFSEKEPQSITAIEKNRKFKSMLQKLYSEEKIRIDKVIEILEFLGADSSKLIKSWTENYEFE